MDSKYILTVDGEMVYLSKDFKAVVEMADKAAKSEPPGTSVEIYKLHQTRVKELKITVKEAGHEPCGSYVDQG